ncbi:tyrosine-protein phosphatase [Galbibacter mesophilus]|uniref:tyrosine-protein phosphatase n=1 Tax=Galbibacter mesophilus TaxID=379069 RepID=UPI00191DF4E8|nr:CpsB/CapC family capsule biosynthesis tyrosine phosphatase [Galbibacter mesophilus]MCM5663435.1 histidinol phosphatase [Galbibacter mesophilus]
MLTIFRRNKRLVDLFNNFIDIHCHIMPGIDDGAKNVEASYYLIKKAQSLGITGFIGTPHVMADLYPNTPQTIGASFDELKEHLLQQKVELSWLGVAAEYQIDSEFEVLLNNKNLLFLHENYILVELPFLQVPMNVERIVQQLIDNGYQPILAHPERYRYFHQQKHVLDVLKNMGCKLQVNALSLSQYYGKSIHKMALDLVEENYIDFIATDMHHQQHLANITEIMLNKKIEKNIEELVHDTKSIFC